MTDLRLVPAAAVVWLATIALLVHGPWAAAWVVALAGGIAVGFRHYGQALTVVVMGVGAVVSGWYRLRIARAVSWPGEFYAKLQSAPKQTAKGWIMDATVDGVPGSVPVFSKTAPGAINAGDVVRIAGTVQESERPSLTGVFVAASRVELAKPADGWTAMVREWKQEFAARVGELVGSPGAGLLPAMTNGDVSLQSVAEKQAYVATGLAHLSAVSGGNVAIVATVAVVAAAALGAGPRGQMVVSALAIGGFAFLVGPEPSVLRASVTGAIGIAAMLASTRAVPIHSLSIAVLGLIFYDTDFAVRAGFALSVAATAGIVVLTPFFYRGMARLPTPDILNRALAVTLAAEVATMPLVALVSGHVSVVGVLANLLVAPLVAPITVLGLAGLLATALPGGGEWIFIEAADPLVSLVGAVGVGCARLPFAHVAVPGVGVAVLLSAWLAVLLIDAKPRAATLMAAAAIGLLLVAR